VNKKIIKALEAMIMILFLVYYFPKAAVKNLPLSLIGFVAWACLALLLYYDKTILEWMVRHEKTSFVIMGILVITANSLSAYAIYMVFICK
jgi:hypothetical protein